MRLTRTCSEGVCDEDRDAKTQRSCSFVTQVCRRKPLDLQISLQIRENVGAASYFYVPAFCFYHKLKQIKKGTCFGETTREQK